MRSKIKVGQVDPRYLETHELTVRLNIGLPRLRRMLNKGRIPGPRNGLWDLLEVREALRHPQRWMNLEEIAEHLDRSPYTVNDWVRQGRIPGPDKKGLFDRVAVKLAMGKDGYPIDPPSNPQGENSVNLPFSEFATMEKIVGTSISLLAAIDSRDLHELPHLREPITRLVDRINDYRRAIGFQPCERPEYAERAKETKGPEKQRKEGPIRQL